MFGNNASFSHFSRNFSQEEIPQQRWGFKQDDLREAPNNISRPSGKSIYMQRKEYSEGLNRRPDDFHVRVEHLFTCELDGMDMKTLDDCVAKLKRLDAKGRLWPQEMIMEAQGGYLLLSDIETKEELDVFPLSSIQKTKAVLDSCAYNSLLTVTVEERSKRIHQVFMFQCEETGAELIKNDLDNIIQNGGSHVEPRREQSDIRSNLENIVGRHTTGSSFRQAGPYPVQRERTPPLPPPLDHPAPQWGNREPENMPHPRAFTPQEEPLHPPDLHELQISPEVGLSLEQIDAERNTGLLDKSLTNPSAPDFVHIFFNNLALVLPQYPADLPPTVLSPLLSEAALRLLAQVVNPEEDQLWRSLGDCWNIPRSRWPDDDVPPYIPEFYDGWQPPAPVNMSPSPHQNDPMSRSNSRRFPSGQPHEQMNDMMQESVSNSPWNSRPPSRSSELPMFMRVMYDFMARNNKELSIMKGEVVEVIQKSKQWWLVRNNRNEEGNVPQNVLEPMTSDRPTEDLRASRDPVSLNMNSTSAEVRAWLEYKRFSKM
ncbi:hypothetical protein PAMP_011935 [Pampus punctatissimus]